MSKVIIRNESSERGVEKSRILMDIERELTPSSLPNDVFVSFLYCQEESETKRLEKDTTVIGKCHAFMQAFYLVLKKVR